MKIIRFDHLPSTQDEIKNHIGADCDVAVVARRQSAGRGTKGRSFSSEDGGLYVSFLVRRKSLPAANAFSVVSDFSLAVAETLRYFSVPALIKWPNDVYALGKKICGMLIENHIENGLITRSFVGVGVNLNNTLPPELESTAISAKTILHRPVDEEMFLEKLIENIYVGYPAGMYAERSCVLGKRVTVLQGETAFEATATDVLPDGRLLLDNGIALSYGEVGIKISPPAASDRS